MDQGLLNFTLPHYVLPVIVLPLLTPLIIYTMKLAGNISMFHQVKSLLEISYVKSLYKGIYLQLPLKAKELSRITINMI
jgi:ABC-type transport system involved in cytochrome c biogenesis permease component